jgi:hypothetical protein
LISIFRHVLNVVSFLLGDSPASDFCSLFKLERIQYVNLFPLRHSYMQLSWGYELHTRFFSNATTYSNYTTTRPSHSITQLLAAVAIPPEMPTAEQQLFVIDLCLTPLQSSPVSPSVTDSSCTVRPNYHFNKTAAIAYPHRDLYLLQG